jgi:hypothetical protein
MTKTTCLLRTFACLGFAALPAGLHAQELIANGNFEGAGLSPWEVSAPAGSAIASVAENSPFGSVFPAGSRAVSLSDDDSEFETPYLRQAFAAQPRTQFSFDFKAVAVSPGSAWYVIWTGEQDTTAFFFSIGGQDGTTLDLNQTSIMPLEAGVWYHVEGVADAPNQIITGSVENSLGQRSNFESGFPFGVQQAVELVTITDGDQAQNQPVVFDNISAKTAVVAAARLSIAPGPNGQVTVSWTAAGYTLQAARGLGPNAQWTDVTTTGQSHTTPAEDPARFFRLVQR